MTTPTPTASLLLDARAAAALDVLRQHQEVQR